MAVGAAIVLALRKCLRHRRLKAEATRSQDTTSVEINRVVSYIFFFQVVYISHNYYYTDKNAHTHTHTGYTN